MTEGACPIPTPEQARFGAALAAIERAMLDKVAAVIAEAHETAERLQPVQDGHPSAPLGYFQAVAHHRLFATLCGADRETGKNGDPAIAAAVLRNFQGLARSWEAVRPAPAFIPENGGAGVRLRKAEP